MIDKIKNFIFEETLNTYDNKAFSSEDLKSFIEEQEAEIELALNCYYRYEDENEDSNYEITQRAWSMYDTVRQYNQPVINALKTILKERGDL